MHTVTQSRSTACDGVEGYFSLCRSVGVCLPPPWQAFGFLAELGEPLKNALMRMYVTGDGYWKLPGRSFPARVPWVGSLRKDWAVRPPPTQWWEWGGMTGVDYAPAFFGFARMQPQVFSKFAYPLGDMKNRKTCEAALYRPVAGFGWAPSEINDGFSSTRWISSKSKEADYNWVAIDLQEQHTLRSVSIEWEGANPDKYKIQVGADGKAWTTVKTVILGDDAAYKRYVETTTLPAGTKGRWLRIFMQDPLTPHGYSLYEVSACGTPVPQSQKPCATYTKRSQCDATRCGWTSGACKPGTPTSCADLKAEKKCTSRATCAWTASTGCGGLGGQTTGQLRAAAVGSGGGGRRRLEKDELPSGLVQVSEKEVGGPMADAIMEAVYGCEWVSGYDWIQLEDAWITSVTSVANSTGHRLLSGVDFALKFSLESTQQSDWGELSGAVHASIRCCQSSGKLQENIGAAMEARGLSKDGFVAKTLAFDKEVQIKPSKAGRNATATKPAIDVVESAASCGIVVENNPLCAKAYKEV